MDLILLATIPKMEFRFLKVDALKVLGRHKARLSKVDIHIPRQMEALSLWSTRPTKMVSIRKVHIYQHRHQFQKLLDELSLPIHLGLTIRNIDSHTPETLTEDTRQNLLTK